MLCFRRVVGVFVVGFRLPKTSWPVIAVGFTMRIPRYDRCVAEVGEAGIRPSSDPAAAEPVSIRSVPRSRCSWIVDGVVRTRCGAMPGWATGGPASGKAHGALGGKLRPRYANRTHCGSPPPRGCPVLGVG